MGGTTAGMGLFVSKSLLLRLRMGELGFERVYLIFIIYFIKNQTSKLMYEYWR
jgi:hypothetical protein